MYLNIKCIGKLPGPTNEFEQSLVFETGEFERPKFDCTFIWLLVGFRFEQYGIFFLTKPSFILFAVYFSI